MALLAEHATRGFDAAGMADGIERRISFLEPADRKLIEMTMQKRLSRREAGLLLGRSSGQVTRRLHLLMRRVNDPVVRALVDHGALLPEGYRGVGLAYFLRGWPVPRIARELGWSPHAVKKTITYVRGWLRASTVGPVPTRRQD